MYRSLILRLELWKSSSTHRPPQTMAGAVCILFLHHHHLLYSHQSLSLEPDNDTVTYTHNTTGDARLQSVLNRLPYSLQPSTVPVPIRINAQSASTSLCITCKGTTCLSAVSLLIWNSQDSQAQWSYLSPQHSGAWSYVFEAAWAIYRDERVLQTQKHYRKLDLDYARSIKNKRLTP